MYNEQASKHDSTMATAFVLLNIDYENGTPSTALGPQMGMEPTSLSRILKRMEELGLIERKPNPEDGRGVIIHLTEFGRDPSDLKWIDWYYGPQQRALASLKTRVLAPTPMYDRATIIGAFQYVKETRNKRKFTDSRLTFNNEDVYVYSLTGDFDKYLDSTRLKTLAYGFDINAVNKNFEGDYIDIHGNRNRKIYKIYVRNINKVSLVYNHCHYYY